MWSEQLNPPANPELQEDDMNWAKSYEEAVKEATGSKKLVLVDVMSPQ